MSRDELDKTITVRPPTVNKKIKPKAHIIDGDHVILTPCRVARKKKKFKKKGIKKK